MTEKEIEYIKRLIEKAYKEGFEDNIYDFESTGEFDFDNFKDTIEQDWSRSKSKSNCDKLKMRVEKGLIK